jgi:hypothetical protein
VLITEKTHVHRYRISRVVCSWLGLWTPRLVVAFGVLFEYVKSRFIGAFPYLNLSELYGRSLAKLIPDIVYLSISSVIIAIVIGHYGATLRISCKKLYLASGVAYALKTFAVSTLPWFFPALSWKIPTGLDAWWVSQFASIVLDAFVSASLGIALLITVEKWRLIVTDVSDVPNVGCRKHIVNIVLVMTVVALFLLCPIACAGQVFMMKPISDAFINQFDYRTAYRVLPCETFARGRDRTIVDYEIRQIIDVAATIKYTGPDGISEIDYILLPSREGENEATDGFRVIVDEAGKIQVRYALSLTQPIPHQVILIRYTDVWIPIECPGE